MCIRDRIDASDALEKLNEIRVAYLGKKGELTTVLKLSLIHIWRGRGLAIVQELLEAYRNAALNSCLLEDTFIQSLTLSLSLIHI